MRVWSRLLGWIALVLALVWAGQVATTPAATAHADDDVPVGAPIGPHVSVLQSCSRTRGRIDVAMVNVLREAATYEVDVTQADTLRHPRRAVRQIEALGLKQVSFVVPGNSLDNYEVIVRRDGVEVHRQPVNPRCGAGADAPESPEASVVNACRNGAGFMRAFYVNPGPNKQDWSVTLTSLSDPTQRVLRRQRTATGFARQAVNFGRRADGVYRIDVVRGDEPIRSFYEEVDCVDSAWNTEPEQLRVLEIAYVPPLPSDPNLVDHRTSVYYLGNETVDQLADKIDRDTDTLAEMLEQGSRSNNGFAVQGIDVEFVDRVEFRQRPPVDTKFLLSQRAEELDPNDARIDPTNPNAFDRDRLRCGGEQIPAPYSFDHLANLEDFVGRIVEDLGNGFLEEIEVTNLVPDGRCVYLSDLSRPNYPEMLEEQLTSLAPAEFSGSGRSFCQYIEDEQIDQVWIWTDHGYEVEPIEAVMSNRFGVSFGVANEGIELNGYRLFPQCDKTYTAYNFNYILSPSVHTFMHAIEGLLGWNPQNYSAADKAIFSWEDPEYNRLDGTFGIECGDSHWAPNVPRRPGENHWAEYLGSITSDTASECFGWNPAAVPTVPIPNPLVHTADTKIATTTMVNCAAWDGCPPDGSANPWTEADPGQGQGEAQVQRYEVWWLRQIPGLGFEHLAVSDGQIYRVTSPWAVFADPDRFIADGATIESMRTDSLLLAGYP